MQKNIGQVVTERVQPPNAVVQSIRHEKKRSVIRTEARKRGVFPEVHGKKMRQIAKIRYERILSHLGDIVPYELTAE